MSNAIVSINQTKRMHSQQQALQTENDRNCDNTVKVVRWYVYTDKLPTCNVLFWFMNQFRCPV